MVSYIPKPSAEASMASVKRPSVRNFGDFFVLTNERTSRSDLYSFVLPLGFFKADIVDFNFDLSLVHWMVEPNLSTFVLKV